MPRMFSLSDIAESLRRLADIYESDLAWRKSCAGLATKSDLQEMEDRMAIKLSELKNEVAGIRGQVTKIWNEQQGKYDALVAAFNDLKNALEDVTLPQDVETDLTEFKAQLTAFDDTIPDTTV